MSTSEGRAGSNPRYIRKAHTGLGGGNYGLVLPSDLRYVRRAGNVDEENGLVKKQTSDSETRLNRVIKISPKAAACSGRLF